MLKESVGIELGFYKEEEKSGGNFEGQRIIKI